MSRLWSPVSEAESQYLQVTLFINPALGCRYFLLGPRLTSQLHCSRPVPIYNRGSGSVTTEWLRTEPMSTRSLVKCCHKTLPGSCCSSQMLFTYLSSEILQSMTVDLLVLTTINGRRMIDPGSGGPLSRSIRRFRSTRFLNAICCTDDTHTMSGSTRPAVRQSHILRLR